MFMPGQHPTLPSCSFRDSHSLNPSQRLTFRLLPGHAMNCLVKYRSSLNYPRRNCVLAAVVRSSGPPKTVQS